MKFIKTENLILFLKIIISVTIPIVFYNFTLPENITQIFFNRALYILIFTISLFFLLITLKFKYLLNDKNENILHLSKVLIFLFLFSLIQIPFHNF